MSISASDSQTPVSTDEEAARWFAQKDFLNGLELEPHGSIDKPEFFRQYDLHREFWDQAFAYLKNTDLLNLPIGTYWIDDKNVFAIVAENPKKDFPETRWEAHKDYVDIQFVIAGKEKMGIVPLAELTLSEPYEEARDVTFYTGDGGEFHTGDPQTFFIFFPSDGHRPDIKVDGFETDKKIVIKVKFAHAA